MNHTAEGIYVVDLSWRLTFLNGRAAEQFRRPQEQLVGQVLWSLFPEAIGTEFETQLRRLAHEKGGSDCVVPSFVEEGRWLEIRVVTREEDIVVYSVDVTGRESLIRDLQATTERLHLLIDSAPAMLSYVNRTGIYQHVNRAYEVWFGMPTASILGRTTEEIIGPEAWKTVKPFKDRAWGGETVTYEIPIKRADGAYRWLHVTNIPDFDADGTVRGMTALARDITARRESQAALEQSEAYHRSLFESSGVGNAEIDVETGRYVRVNNKYCEIVGFSDKALLHGLTEIEITHHDDRARTLATTGELLRGVATSVELEKRFLSSSGEARWVCVTSTVLRDPCGKPNRILQVAHDISKRKHIEGALHRTAEELRQINEATPVAVWVSHDPFCRIITANSAARRIEECLTDENISAGSSAVHDSDASVVSGQRRFFDQNGNELLPAELPMQQAVSRNQEVRDQFLTIRRANGTDFTLFGSAIPLRNEQGQVRGCIGAFMDVTATIDAKRALQDSEERLRLAGRAAGVGYWAWDIHSNRCDLDEICSSMLGCSVVTTLEDVLRRIIPEDREQVQQALLASREGRQPYRAEFRVSHGGGVRWLVGLGDVVRDEKGRALKAVGINVDISDRKIAEEERQLFVSLAENSSDFVAIWGPDRYPLFINKAGLDMVGLQTMEQAQRLQIEELFFPEERGRIINEFFPKVEREGRANIEIRLRHTRTGEGIWINYKVFPVKDSAGQVVAFATVSPDITNRLRTELMLKETDRRKDEFLAMLAHELRNPLAPLSNALHVWEQIQQNPERMGHIRRIMERQIQQLKRLIDDLLDVSRISRGKIEIRREKVALATVLQEAQEALSGAVESCGHKISLSLPTDTVYVDGDTGRLSQVFGNLIHNAVKYSHIPATIAVDLHSDGIHAVVKVRDSGIGIPPSMLGQIFEPFVQVDRAIDRAQGGLGIGLTLVRTLVGLHGGAVEARSDGVGKGSEFIVRLPLAQSDILNHPVNTCFEWRTDRTTGGRSYRVLVVDDLKPSADTLGMVLEELGHEVCVVYDGESALHHLGSFEPEVIFSDIAMPGLDGYRLAQQVSKQAKKRPYLVAVTGYGQEKDRKEALAAGFNQHLVKPAALSSLYEIFASLSTE